MLLEVVARPLSHRPRARGSPGSASPRQTVAYRSCHASGTGAAASRGPRTSGFSCTSFYSSTHRDLKGKWLGRRTGRATETRLAANFEPSVLDSIDAAYRDQIFVKIHTKLQISELEYRGCRYRALWNSLLQIEQADLDPPPQAQHACTSKGNSQSAEPSNNIQLHDSCCDLHYSFGISGTSREHFAASREARRQRRFCGSFRSGHT